MLKTKLRNLSLFDSKKSYIDDRIYNEFVDHGIITVPCHVDGIDDIISRYSVKNYESLSEEFTSYVVSTVDAMPLEYPVVLSIVGHEFSEEEQKIIRDTIEADFAYYLGTKEKENSYHIKVFLFMVIGMVICGILIYFFGSGNLFTVEMIFVFFWFFAETAVSYLLIEGFTLKKQKITAGRLACVEVEFSKVYDDSEYTKNEAQKIIKDIVENNEYKP